MLLSFFFISFFFLLLLLSIPKLSFPLAEHEAAQASWHPQGPAGPDFWAASWCWCHQSDVSFGIQLDHCHWTWTHVYFFFFFNLLFKNRNRSASSFTQVQRRVRWREPLSERHTAWVCWSHPAVAWGWEWQGLWHTEGHSLSLQRTGGQYHSECSRYISS